MGCSVAWRSAESARGVILPTSAERWDAWPLARHGFDDVGKSGPDEPAPINFYPASRGIILALANSALARLQAREAQRAVNLADAKQKRDDAKRALVEEFP